MAYECDCCLTIDDTVMEGGENSVNIGGEIFCICESCWRKYKKHALMDRIIERYEHAIEFYQRRIEVLERARYGMILLLCFQEKNIKIPKPIIDMITHM